MDGGIQTVAVGPSDWLAHLRAMAAQFSTAVHITCLSPGEELELEKYDFIIVSWCDDLKNIWSSKGEEFKSTSGRTVALADGAPADWIKEAERYFVQVIGGKPEPTSFEHMIEAFVSPSEKLLRQVWQRFDEFFKTKLFDPASHHVSNSHAPECHCMLSAFYERSQFLLNQVLANRASTYKALTGAITAVWCSHAHRGETNLGELDLPEYDDVLVRFNPGLIDVVVFALVSSAWNSGFSTEQIVSNYVKVESNNLGMDIKVHAPLPPEFNEIAKELGEVTNSRFGAVIEFDEGWTMLRLQRVEV